MVKMALNEEDLPPVIRQRIIDDFRQFEIDDIDQVKTGDQVLYQIALDGPSRGQKVVYNVDGEVDDNFNYWD